MLEINGKKFLNEQEAICYLLNEVQTLKQSLGSALPDPIEGPQGPTGATGATGPQGERGTGVFGCSAVLPSPTAYKEGDFYVLFNGDLYKKISPGSSAPRWHRRRLRPAAWRSPRSRKRVPRCSRPACPGIPRRICPSGR